MIWVLSKSFDAIARIYLIVLVSAGVRSGYHASLVLIAFVAIFKAILELLGVAVASIGWLSYLRQLV